MQVSPAIPMATFEHLPADTQCPLVKVGFSARALFDLEKTPGQSLEVWLKEQRGKAKEPLKPASGMPLFRKLLALNRLCPDDKTLVGVHVFSKLTPEFAGRFHDSLDSLQLNTDCERSHVSFSYLNGASPLPFLQAMGINLYLSANQSLVEQALAAGIGAAVLQTEVDPDHQALNGNSPLKIALDGDSCIFDDEADKLYKSGGLTAVWQSDAEKRDKALGQGPLHKFLVGINNVRRCFPREIAQSPLLLYLVTARGFNNKPRVFSTMNDLELAFDGAHFLSGESKEPVLRGIAPHLFSMIAKRILELQYQQAFLQVMFLGGPVWH
ncbi:MAG: 5'-nucleotidase [Deltaproteobacteria bacterium]|nr:MAG: 5'-nucleotidase [Deltaproteobacteria bacterium]